MIFKNIYSSPLLYSRGDRIYLIQLFTSYYTTTTPDSISFLFGGTGGYGGDFPLPGNKEREDRGSRVFLLEGGRDGLGGYGGSFFLSFQYLILLLGFEGVGECFDYF